MKNTTGRHQADHLLDERGHLTKMVNQMFETNTPPSLKYNKRQRTRQTRLQCCHVATREVQKVPLKFSNDELLCISAGDVVPEDTALDFLNVRNKRSPEHHYPETSYCRCYRELYANIPKSKLKNFKDVTSTMGEYSKMKQVQKAKEIQQSLVAAVAAGRRYDMHSLLQHGLSEYPLSLLKPNKSLNVANKAILS